MGMPLAVSNGDVIIVVVLLVVPIAAIAFAGAGSVYREIGKGAFSMDHDKPNQGGGGLGAHAARVEQQVEIRQMLEAKALRQRKRGEEPIDVEAEIKRLSSPAAIEVRADPALVAEVRQLVVARNARRARQGKEPLDVEVEVARQLRDLEGLGD
jgi:hypothetical protein